MDFFTVMKQMEANDYLEERKKTVFGKFLWKIYQNSSDSFSGVWMCLPCGEKVLILQCTCKGQLARMICHMNSISVEDFILRWKANISAILRQHFSGFLLSFCKNVHTWSLDFQDFPAYQHENVRTKHWAKRTKQIIFYSSSEGQL